MVFPKKNSGKRLKRRIAWLKCPHCSDPFLKGRSYSNHVSRCPAMKLPVRKQQITLSTTRRESLPLTSAGVLPFASATTDNSCSGPRLSPDTHNDDSSSLSSVLSTNIRSEQDDHDSFFEMSNDVHDTDDNIPDSSSAVNDNLVTAHNSYAVNANHRLFPVSSVQCHTTDDAVHLQLMNLCHEIRAPLYAFDSILKWAQHSHLSGYQFPANAPSRETYLDRLYTRFNMNQSKPIVSEVNLFPDKQANVVTFSFHEMVQSLLSDPSLMTAENLLFNTVEDGDDSCDFRSDINTGSWFTKAKQSLCQSSDDLLCPIILFIDKTQIDTLSKWSLEPVLFTLGIFNRATRNLSHAWRPLGLVTNTLRMSSATRAQLGKKGNSIQNYHRILEVILKDLVNTQALGGVKATIVCKGITRKVTLRVPVAFVVGDCEGSDKLCGRYGTHQLGNALVCRDCDCPTLQADNPSIRCLPITLEAILDANGEETDDHLKLLSHHRLDNAFHKVCFGNDDQGIHGCSPPEMLHLYQQGLYKYALESFINSLTKEQCRALDQLISKISHSCHRQSDRSFPRFRFPRGVTNLSCFTAAEQVGVTLVCYLAISVVEFRTSVLLRYDASKRSYFVDPVALQRCDEFRSLFEKMLITESWINQDTHSKEEIQSIAPQKITQFMVQYRDTIQRTTGNGLKIPKFHQLKHLPRYILKFGSPNNFNTSRCEAHHIALSKRPAKTAQKRDDGFEEQVGKRIVDNIVLTRATNSLLMGPPTTPNNHFQNNVSGMKFTVTKLEMGGSFTAISCSEGSKVLSYDEHLISSFGDEFCQYFPGMNGIPCFTEHYRTDDTGKVYLFRGHPCYRGAQWFDWAYFQWSKDDDQSLDGFDEIPARIMFFLDARTMHSHPHFDAGVYAIVESLSSVPVNVRGSRILTHSRSMNDKSFNCCHVDSIVDVALVIPNVGSPNGDHLIISPPAKWPSFFL